MPLAQSAQPYRAADLSIQRKDPFGNQTIVRSSRPRLSVVIVNYCQWKETAGLTRQILKTPEAHRQDIEVVIIDNNSSFHRIVPQLRRWPGVSLRRWQHNRGFARAANEGCRLSRGDWFLLLNPDITLGSHFIKGVWSLVDRLPLEDPKTGIVGFRLLNTDGTLQLSAGNFPTLWSIFTKLWKPRYLRKYTVPPANRPTEVAWVTGCCLLINRACFRQVGGLDEDFFLYYEDVDVCRRARSLGWKVRFDPGLRAIHHHPLHSRPVTTALRVFTRHALLVYGLKHWPCWQFRLLARFVQCEAWVKQAWNTFQGRKAAAVHFRKLRTIAKTVSPKGAKKALACLKNMAN
jgi:GT2 family glycosyltransferase